MIKETHECRECGSSNIVKNGHSASGSKQYHCKDCGAHKVLDPEPRGYSEEEKAEILRAYRERGSKRAISRIFGISRNTLTRWLKKKGREMGLVAEGLRLARDNDTLELDECWTCAWKRSNKRWLWVALCRRTRQVVANAQGDRSAKTCARLWSRIPQSDSSKATGKAEASATSGSLPKRQLHQCLRRTQLTDSSESPVARWSTSNGSSGDCGRSWCGTSAGRERLPSQSGCYT